MGLLKHLLLGDAGQSWDIVETQERLKAQQNLQSVQRRHASARDIEIARLKKRTEQLNLGLVALTRYLISEGVISEEKLSDFIDKIDREDGEKDERLAFDETAEKPKLKFD